LVAEVARLQSEASSWFLNSDEFSYEPRFPAQAVYTPSERERLLHSGRLRDMAGRMGTILLRRSRAVSRTALFLVLLAVGSSRTAAEPPPGPVLPKNTFGLPADIDPRKLAFTGEGAGEKFLKLDAAARKIAGAQWAKRAGDRYPYLSWNSGSDGYNQTYLAAWEKAEKPKSGKPTRPNHTIHIDTTLYAGNPTTASGFSLRADCLPKTGWGAAVSFSTHDGKRGLFEWFQLMILHDELLPAPGPATVPGLLLGPGRAWYSTIRTENNLVYHVQVSSRSLGVSGFSQKPLGQEIARYWASAESFRDAALEELDFLTAEAKETIASGKAVSITTKGGPTGADVPRPVAPGPLTLPESLKTAVLKDALAEIEARKKMVREHFKDMYAATVASFPGLGEILAPPKKK
jgi:hypothetical protein